MTEQTKNFQLFAQQKTKANQVTTNFILQLFEKKVEYDAKIGFAITLDLIPQ